ncbi:hypothetical protein [Ferrimicrobium acidiphilum]|uniref:Uncharacterized protein n=1 Tax=Ferrimicrobium acidiphilum DSM 19497 TaxID=1121877 RepID=A0A0D8FUG5_9ACTN|nr:hypothetical protein [Ferrimicrobium acidiphilum]KJE76604.1 hypothetical protein FEAC_16840 [Ferrimicrobium acidiphilum DSM 19497]MCL5053940.1 hypothetical protein [Gammaproteobacteria bacterium]
MKVPWRVRLTLVGAFIATYTSLRNVLEGYNGWSIYLEHLLIALLVVYVGLSIVATVTAWYNLQNLAERRRRSNELP